MLKIKAYTLRSEVCPKGLGCAFLFLSWCLHTQACTCWFLFFNNTKTNVTVPCVTVSMFNCNLWIVAICQSQAYSDHAFSDLSLDQRIYECFWLKAERNLCPIVNIKCRQDFLTSLFPVNQLTPTGRYGCLHQETIPENMHPDKLNCHIHVFFTCGCFVCQDSHSFQARFGKNRDIAY